MKKAKKLVAAAVVLLMLVSGAVTVYAVSADQGKAPVPVTAWQTVTADYAAEEMAVGAFYEAGSPEV